MKKLLLLSLFFSANVLAWPIDTYRNQTQSELFKPKGEITKLEVSKKDFTPKPGMARIRIDTWQAGGVGWGNPLWVKHGIIASVVLNEEIVDNVNYSKDVVYIDIKPGKQNIGVYEVAGHGLFTGDFFVKKGDGFEYLFEEGKSYSMTFSKQDFGVYKLSMNDVLKIN